MQRIELASDRAVVQPLAECLDGEPVQDYERAPGESSGAPGEPLELTGSPQELLATIRQFAPLKWLVNRFNRHSRATSSQLYSANTFVDLSIPQTLEA